MAIIKAIGKITKKDYCTKCFNIISWDDPSFERTFTGNRYVECPICGARIDISDAIVDLDNVIEDAKVVVDGMSYASVEQALDNLSSDSKVTIEQDINLEKSLTIAKDQKVELTIDKGATVTLSQPIQVQGTLTLNGEGAITYTKRVALVNEGVLTIEGNVTVTSTTDCALQGSNKAVININGGHVNAQEFGVLVTTGAELNITDGEIVAKDNAAVGGNGSAGVGDTTINIKGGTLISNIESAGYVACGVYSPNVGKVNISGGKIIANNGAGVVARGGKINITGGEIIATGDPATVGKVGDSRVVVTCSGVVYDKNSKYPGMDSLEIKISGGTITGSKSSVEVLTDEETPKIAIKGGTLTPPFAQG